MRKNELVLWAMLVSSVMPAMPAAADNDASNSQVQVQLQQPAIQPQVFRQSEVQPAAAATGQSIRTFRPGQQVAMFHPAFANADLVKTLYGWSATITVEFTRPVSTKTAQIGDLVETKLTQDFRWGPQLIAAKDSLVRGHVTESNSGRTLTHSLISSNRRLKSRGLMAIQFDEIIDTNGRRWPILATPSPRQKSSEDIGHSTKRTLEADSNGRIVKAQAELTGGLKTTSQVAKVATFVPVPGTMLVSTLAPAVAMGAVGAASPSVAYDKPIDENTENRRVKGAAYGFASNLPGAFVVKAVVEKGSEVELIPGDELTLIVSIKETGYKLPPGEQLEVNGKIVRPRKTKRLYPASNDSGASSRQM